MIDATRFAKPTEPKPFPDDVPRAFRFGTAEPQAMAAELHRFADAVSEGKVLLQAVQSGQKTDVDDYAMQALYIEFAEAQEIPA